MADLQDRIHDYLSAAADNGFAGCVLVERDGDVIFERGYGLANRANAIPVTSSTIFNIGHLTRQFTVAAVLKLQEEGDLALSTALGAMFPGCPADKAGITVMQLLRHEAGISPRAGSYRYDFVPRDQFLRELFRERLAHAPGSGSAYANAGYILLAAIVEQMSGNTFEAYLRDKLLLPAGMAGTGYVMPEWDVAAHAHSYFFDIEREGWVEWGTTIEQFGFEGVSWYTMGKGDMLSSASDMLRWHRALRDHAVLSPASRALFDDYLRLEQPD